MAKIRGLGKGLASLIPTAESPITEDIIEEILPEAVSEKQTEDFLRCDHIFPNPFQPRKQMDRENLSNLVSSIREHGVIQPVLVRFVETGYQIVAGERRWRAAQSAGLETIPVRILQIDDSQAMELALVENLQREDLTTIEVARGIQELITKLNLTHEDVARRIGFSRTAVTNKLRLLQLPMQVIDMLERGTITEGHARALLSLPDEGQMFEVALLAAQKGMSVRQLEELVRNQGIAAKIDAVLPKREESSYGLPEEIETLCKNHKLTIRVADSRKGMGLLIKGLKRWQVQLLLEHIDKYQEELFPVE